MNDRPTRFVSVKEAAEQLGVPKTWLDRMIEDREFSCLRTPNRTRVSVDQLEEEIKVHMRDNR